MLIFEARFFSLSAYKQRRNPPKIYMVDPGLAMRAKSKDWGRALENVINLCHIMWQLFQSYVSSVFDFLEKRYSGAGRRELRKTSLQFFK